MNIAFISLMAGSQWGGSEELWYRAALSAKEDGHNVLASIYQWETTHPKLEVLRRNGVTIHWRERYTAESSLLYKARLFIRNRIEFMNNTYEAIFKFRPDHAVISQGGSFDISIHHYSLLLALKKNNIKYSLICHSHSQYGEIPTENIYPRAVNIFKEADNVFFVSERMKKLTERRLCTRLPNAKVILNPLNLKDFSYINWPETKKLNFAVVGALEGNKGHDTLLECLSGEIWESRHWHLNFYGKGYGRKYLEDLTGFYNLSGRVTFHGFVDSIEKVWEINHLLLIPSSGEGLPISLVEAAICGRPAVVADVGGNTEVIDEEETGFIAEAPSVSSFANALERAWEKRTCWESMGKKFHELIKKNYSLAPEKEFLKYIIPIR